ncbi:MAG: hypothetical protein IM600_06810 [Bacteroidetes bacterium]|jgi:hypothetical protein|nr:hypothetical protein [Bacteroidota bacterium]MCA6443119.1 hypothetical protein [Bacteroidota bacterium]
MCFSANASFGAGIVLSVISVASIKKVKRPSQFAFASIPLIFAVQQFTEGLLWVSLTNPLYAYLQQPSTYIFLFFAQVVWPVWVPLAILLLAEKEKRKMIEKILVVIGCLVSLCLAYCLLSFNVQAKVIGFHIAYAQDYPSGLNRYGGLLYVIATIVPPFFSPIKRMWTLGTAILISYIITTLLYTDYIVSVWCFFASVISILVFAIMYHINISHKDPIKVVALLNK